MPRKVIRPIRGTALDWQIAGHKNQSERVAHLRNIYNQLPDTDRQVIDGAVQAIVHYVRTSQHCIGPAGAFELIGALGEFLAKKEMKDGDQGNL